MVISLAPSSETVRSGLRQINLRTDLRAIADLIDEAFADELDAAGRASLRELRTLSRLGPLLYLLAPPGGELGGFFRGFVWQEAGQVVGNVTLQQLDGYGQRWMVANVAVHKGYRGQGIARALMEASLERVRQLGGEWILLQVRNDNDVARGLYRRLGFEDVGIETYLRSFSVPEPPAPPQPEAGELQLLPPGDSLDVQYLINRTLPEIARWWHPFRRGDFRRGTDIWLARLWGSFNGSGYRRRFGLWQDRDMMAVLDVDVRPRGEHRLDVLVHPDLRGRWEPWLLASGLQLLRRHPQRPVTAILYEYQAEAIAALRDFGFRITRELATMRKRVRRLSEHYA